MMIIHVLDLILQIQWYINITSFKIINYVARYILLDLEKKKDIKEQFI